MRVALMGGTSGMGRALARRMAERGDRVFLLGRDRESLARSAADLALRAHADDVGYAVCDLSDASAHRAGLDAARSALGEVDCVVVTAADFAAQDALEADPARCAALLDLNFTKTIHFCEAARPVLLRERGGTLCVFSSVAGERGRSPVVLYGASKAGLSAYLEGLDHRFHRHGLRVVAVKPGFVRTRMTAGLRPPPFAGEPEEVAGRVLAAIDRGAPEVYAPRAWGWIMHVIRRLPRFAMRRLEF